MLQEIDEVERSHILKHEQRDAEEKIPFVGLMSKGEHARIDTNTAHDRCHKKDETFRDSFGVIMA